MKTHPYTIRVFSYPQKWYYYQMGHEKHTYNMRAYTYNMNVDTYVGRGLYFSRGTTGPQYLPNYVVLGLGVPKRVTMSLATHFEIP